MRPLALLVSGLLIAATFPIIPSTAAAVTYVVRPDGTGDLPTIQAAIDVCTDGDVVELTTGTFTSSGNRDIDFLGKSITVRSQDGHAATCVIDCEGGPGDPHRGFIFDSGEDNGAVLEAMTIQHAFVNDEGAAIYCEASAPRIDRCILQHNNAAELGGGGAVYADDGAAPVIVDCVFMHNHARQGGGVACYDAAVTLSGCEFSYCDGGSNSGAILGHNATIIVEDCSFTFCSASYGGVAALAGGASAFTRCTFFSNFATSGGALASDQSTVTVSSCTFWGNSAPGGACLWVGIDGITIVERSILAFSIRGPAVQCQVDGMIQLECSDVFGNAGGDWVDCISSQQGINGNIAADPLFCGAPQADFTLHEQSPCAPAHSGGCELIGAWPVGCGATPVEPTTWGQVKAHYR